ncbi:hypothetical protein ACEH99_000152 [Vibrio vulnificus]|nr:hypothetical protein [Vibrio parahaemolyticus]EIZ1900446.1 hypothetical protein [Vibrio parahaemolyticus]EJA3093942.1 hypothetical protein [Vibrio parahaemolyticus]
MQISIKNNQYQPVLNNTTLGNVYKATRDGLKKSIVDRVRAAATKEEAKKIKSELPLFFPCVYHDLEGGAAIEKPMTHTGMMVFDIDGIDQTDSERLRDVLLQSSLKPFIRMVFKSPSGGLKFIMQTNFKGDDNQWHHYCYKKIMAVLLKIGFPQQHVDGATCNMNRGTYLSYDPDCHYTENVATFDLSRWIEPYQAEHASTKSNQVLDEIAINNGDINRDYALNSMNQAFRTIVRSMGSGNRHDKIYTVCAQCYDRGLTESDAINYLNQLKVMGHYTDKEDVRTKAALTYKFWKRNGGIIDLKFKNYNRSTNREYFAKTMYELFV